MASNYQQFEEEEDKFGVSASNLSFVEFVDDEIDNETMEISRKDKNNNGSHLFSSGTELSKSSLTSFEVEYHERPQQGLSKQSSNSSVHPGSQPSILHGSIHWEQKEQSLVDLDADESGVSSLSLQFSPPMSSKHPLDDGLLVSPLGANTFPQDERLSDVSSYLAGDSVSSGDETESDVTLVRGVKIRASRSSRSETSLHSFHNRNENNNKKKKLLNHDANAKESASETSAKRSNVSTQNLPKSRFRSVQLPSIRSLPTKTRNKPGLWVRNVEYGQRLVEKNGASNIQITNTGKFDLYSRYVSDIFTTLLDSSWGWVLFVTSSVYIGHWIIFGIIYLTFAMVNGDYDKIKGIDNHDVNQTIPVSDSLLEPCVSDVYDMTTAFLFSLESETTIGYGSRSVTTQCPIAVMCLTVQCIISAIFDTWVIGVCFARLARPDARIKTTLFSKKAVICKRDGKRCLLVRFANLRKSLLVNVSVSSRLITLRNAHCREKAVGHQKVLEQCQVTFNNAAAALLTAPIEYCHVIDKDSPLYGIKSDMYNSTNGKNYFELVFVVTGTLESTGLTMHAQTSYLSSEILHGYRFTPVVTKAYERSKYVVDFKHFHSTVPETIKNNDKTIDAFGRPPGRDVSAPLMEETEDELISAADDVFSSENTATRAESVL